MRLLAELPQSKLIAAVEAKVGTVQPPFVTFFVVELLDTIARRRNEGSNNEGSNNDGSSNSSSNQEAGLQVAEGSEGRKEAGTGRM